MEERALVRAAQAGSVEATDRLFRAIWPVVLRCARSRAAYPDQVEEIAQEAMTGIFTGLRGFDRSRRLAPWCWQITANAAARYKRSAAISRRRNETLETVLRPEDGAGELVELEDQIALGQALAKLEPSQRELINLVAEGLPVRKIASLLGQSKSTVQRRKAEALGALRKEMGV